MADGKEEEDEALDFTSPKFNPLKALYSKNVRLPIENAPVFDNIHKYHSSLNPREKKKKVDKDSEPGPSSEEQPVRRFLPHQQPVRNPRPQRDTRNVLTRMENATGPLSLLWDCMERRVRIKVLTRHMAGMRGYCVAFLAAFDKQWNLALEDVREVWTRRKRRKVPALGEPSAVSRAVLQPRVVVLRTERKSEVCERHVNQLLVRGEHVVLISVLQP
ncbi:U7 snRNA-associated Sm-like protein LSm11 [Cryptotermes secundus]|uniref:U7 snRNA-associated Sm-like protein LSm11 n=1 Tax=Cryptotermes secundus TaxID=105785 RepID=UPI000CD7D3CF|nr:U7 snRNA-associated Sm-like protein LSm11 [Cryptotermes secundus]